MISKYNFCFVKPTTRVYIIYKARTKQTKVFNPCLPNVTMFSETFVTHHHYGDEIANVMTGFSNPSIAQSVVDSIGNNQDLNIASMDADELMEIACMLRTPSVIVASIHCDLRLKDEIYEVGYKP